MFFEFQILFETDINQMWWLFFLVTDLHLKCVCTRGWPNGKTYCSCFFPSVAFYNKLQNIGLVGRDQLQRTLKKDKCKYQLFFKKSKHISSCLSLCVQFSVYFCYCECMYMFLCGSSCTSECDVLITIILMLSTTSSKC